MLLLKNGQTYFYVYNVKQISMAYTVVMVKSLETHYPTTFVFIFLSMSTPANEMVLFNPNTYTEKRACH